MMNTNLQNDIHAENENIRECSLKDEPPVARLRDFLPEIFYIKNFTYFDSTNQQTIQTCSSNSII